MPVQGLEPNPFVSLPQPVASDDYHVNASQEVLMVPKAFTNDPFDPVAHHGGPGSFTGHSQTQPGEIQIVRTSQDGKTGIRGFDRLCEDSPKVGFLSKSGALSKVGVVNRVVLRGPNGHGPWHDAL